MSERSVQQVRYAVGRSTLGAVGIVAGAHGVRAIELGDDAGSVRRAIAERFSAAGVEEDAEGLAEWLACALAVVEGTGDGCDLPLESGGTEFQREVWAELRRIPSGATRTYAEVADALGRPTAARAVARACATNELAVVVPCHRVVRSDGSLSGYRWGVERKRALLERERGRG